MPGPTRKLSYAADGSGPQASDPPRGPWRRLGACRAVAPFLLLGLSLASGATGFEPPAPLGELIANADAVVVGTLAGVADSSFALDVEQVLVGEVEGGRIEVEKFPAPAESPRWTAYARGQTVVVFLDRAPGVAADGKAPIQRYSILGRIGEGEIPLDGKYAYFHSRFIDVLEQDYYRFHGQTAYIQRFDRESTIEAIRSYRQCFAWRQKPEVVCSEASLSAYRARSALHDFLVREAQDANDR